MIALDARGKQVSSEDDVSQLFEKLKVSPGGGLLSDGSATIFLGQSNEQPRNQVCSPTDNLLFSPEQTEQSTGSGE